MTLKGRKFTAANAPRRLQERNPTAAEQWAKDQTQRFRVVAHDRAAREGDQELIFEELEPRALRLLSAKARALAGTLLNAPLEVRLEVLAAFTDKGALRLPFEFPKITGVLNIPLDDAGVSK